MLNGQERTKQQPAEQKVRLSEQQFVQIELGHQHDCDPAHDAFGLPPRRQCRDGSCDEKHEQPDRHGKEQPLRVLLVEHAERGQHQRRNRKVLVPVVSVFGAVERLGVETPNDVLPQREEVDHFAANARLIGDGGQQDECEHGERPKSRRHAGSIGSAS